MNQNPLKDGSLTENSVGLGTVTRELVSQRAVELAIIGGRSAQDVTPSDWQQAKRELSGDANADVDRKTALLESAPEAERWDPLPGSTGHKVRVAPSEDEDAEGRSDNDRLFEEGIAAAEHDQMLQATQAAAKNDL
jgi:hypothetical protein